MPKILLVSFFFPPKFGGIENSLADLCQRLPKEEIVVLADKEGNWQDFDQKQSFKIYRAKFFGSKFLKPSWLLLFFKIWQIIKKEKIEVILFGHYANYCLLGPIFRKIFKIPFLIYGRGVDVLIYQKGKISKFFLKSNLKNASRVLANSHFTKNEICKLGIPEKNVIVVHPGIDLEKFNPNKISLEKIEKIKDKFGLKNKKIILYVGRLAKIKGIDLVIKALPEIKKQIQNIVFLVVGKGEDEEELRKLVKELNLEKTVIFVGPVEKPEEAIPYYFLTDLYVGPSRILEFVGYKHQESFGSSFIEAQAIGKPVVATKVGGIPEVVSESKTGLLVPPDDLTKLTEAIVKLLINKNLIEELSQNTKKWVEKFSWSNQINLLKRILNEINK